MRIDGESETFIPEVAPCLTQNYGKQPDNSDTSAGPMLVPVAFRAAGQEGFVPREQAPPLCATNGGGTVPSIAFTERTRADGRNLESQEELAYALTNPGSGGRTHSRQVMTPQMGVRRLTPTECERLQGYSDHYTAITYRGKPAKDGPRYKSLGNSMAVPCVRWIANRIVEALNGSSQSE